MNHKYCQDCELHWDTTNDGHICNGVLVREQDSPDVAIAVIATNLWGGSVVADARIIVFKADVSLDKGGGTFHRADSSSHVSVANVLEYTGRNLAVFCSSYSYACISDVMDDVVEHGAVFTNLNSRRAGLADVFVALHVALRGVVLFPFCIVVTPNAGHCKSI